MEDKIKKYGLRLKTVRTQMGLTREEISQSHGFAIHSIRRWESGEYEIGFVTLQKYLEMFKDYGVNIPLKIFADLERLLEIELRLSKTKKKIK